MKFPWHKNISPTGAPPKDELIAHLERCTTADQVATLLTGWFGTPYSFTTTTENAYLIAKHSPFISFELAQTLHALDKQTWWRMLDPARVSKQFLEDQLRQSIKSINEYKTRLAETPDPRNPSAKIEFQNYRNQLAIRATYLIEQPLTKDADLANLVPLIIKFVDEAERPWAALANHPNAESLTWTTMAERATDYAIATALAHKPSAVNYFIVAAALRYQADLFPELLLAFVRADGKGLTLATKEVIRTQWAWLVKNKPEELLGVRDKVSDAFLYSLPKEALGAMLLSPHKPMREWGVRATGTHQIDHESPKPDPSVSAEPAQAAVPVSVKPTV